MLTTSRDVPHAFQECTLPDLGWERSITNPQKAWHHYTTPASFTVAKRTCEQMQGRLGTFKDNIELQQLREMGELNYFAVTAYY